MQKNLGEFYDKTSDFQQVQFNYLTDLVQNTLSVDTVKRLMDIGAGTGLRTKQCFDLFPNLSHITAIEPDPDMYAQALESHCDPRIKYLQKSASHIKHLDIKDKYFDAILSHWTLHWIEDKQAIFEDLESVIADKSAFIFSSCERLPQILFDIDEYIRAEFGISLFGESPFHYLDKKEWEALVKANGWNVKAIETLTVDHVEKDAKTYLEHWFTASTAKFTYNRQLDEIDELSRKDIIWFMENKYGDNLGGLKFTEDVIFVIAEKV